MYTFYITVFNSYTYSTKTNRKIDRGKFRAKNIFESHYDKYFCQYLSRPLLTASLKSGSQDTLPPLTRH